MIQIFVAVFIAIEKEENYQLHDQIVRIYDFFHEVLHIQNLFGFSQWIKIENYW